MENEKRSGKWGKIKSRVCHRYGRIPDHLKKTLPLHIRPFGTVFLMYVGVN
jgi:hypothetical protein